LIPAMRASTPSRRPARLACAAILSATVVALASGCGSSGESTTTVTAPNITSIRDLAVTGHDIQSAGEASPAAALLRWWQAIQLGHVRSAINAYSRSVDTKAVPKEIKHLDYFFVRSKPKIVESKVAGDTVRVLTVVDGAAFEESDPNKVLVVTQTPTSFELKREQGRWKLANDDYMEQMFRTRGLAR
jgi:hypothetical protein